MVYVQYRWRWGRTLFNILMLVSVIIFGDVGAMSVYQVIIEGNLFMTAIHGVFLNPLFLATGGYIGLYIIYRLLLLSGKELQGSDVSV